jgi:hypothetical protein
MYMNIICWYCITASGTTDDGGGKYDVKRKSRPCEDKKVDKHFFQTEYLRSIVSSTRIIVIQSTTTNIQYIYNNLL